MVDAVSLVLVGALWGCTNPLLRKGSMETASESPRDEKRYLGGQDSTAVRKIASSIAKFRNVRVWLPYALNQCGSVLFYFALSQSNLSLAVPPCNALALIFSVATSHLLGEGVDRPVRTAVGAALVLGGVAVCLLSKEQQQQEGGGVET